MQADDADESEIPLNMLDELGVPSTNATSEKRKAKSEKRKAT